MLQLHPKLCVKSDHIKKTLTGAERNKHYRCKIQVPFICKKKIAKRRPAFRLMWKFLTRKNLKRGDAWVKVTCWRKTKSFFLATAVQVHIGFMEWCFANNKSLLPLIACHDYLSTNYIEGNGEDGVISSVFLFKQACMGRSPSKRIQMAVVSSLASMQDVGQPGVRYMTSQI